MILSTTEYSLLSRDDLWEMVEMWGRVSIEGEGMDRPGIYRKGTLLTFCWSNHARKMWVYSPVSYGQESRVRSTMRMEFTPSYLPHYASRWLPQCKTWRLGWLKPDVTLRAELV